MLAGWRSDGYRVFEQPNGEGRSMLMAEQLEPLPDDLPLVIGDSFQCLRNSIDHIVFALTRKNTPAMSSEDEDKPSFPIQRSASGGAITASHGSLRFLHPTARQAVCGVAPDPARQQLDQAPVWLLNKMSNRDKHREVGVSPSASSGVGSYCLYASDGTDYFQSFERAVLQPGAAAVALCEFAQNPNVRAEIGHSLQVLFDQGVEVANREVAPTLRWMHDHIRDTVFQRLEAHL